MNPILAARMKGSSARYIPSKHGKHGPFAVLDGLCITELKSMMTNNSFGDLDGHRLHSHKHAVANKPSSVLEAFRMLEDTGMAAVLGLPPVNILRDETLSEAVCDLIWATICHATEQVDGRLRQTVVQAANYVRAKFGDDKQCPKALLPLGTVASALDYDVHAIGDDAAMPRLICHAGDAVDDDTARTGD